ncbi:hypothetical protein SAMN02910456_01335 [Ruminococcaceae bacterium YRB3002]|nr:hypothetical protein SAMN02910456_01335 [Ruminococcaceae bacterium YRB3002]
MNRSTIKGFAFIASNILCAVALFLPYFHVSYEGKSGANVSMMPTVFGIILLLTDIVSVGFVFAGLQTKCGFAAAANVCLTIAAVIRMGLSKKAMAANALMDSGGFMSLLTDSTYHEYDISYGIGFYLLIAGAVAAIVTGIMFAIEND